MLPVRTKGNIFALLDYASFRKLVICEYRPSLPETVMAISLRALARKIRVLGRKFRTLGIYR
jgi:hypothetical protein